MGAVFICIGKIKEVKVLASNSKDSLAKFSSLDLTSALRTHNHNIGKLINELDSIEKDKVKNHQPH